MNLIRTYSNVLSDRFGPLASMFEFAAKSKLHAALWVLTQIFIRVCIISGIVGTVLVVKGLYEDGNNFYLKEADLKALEVACAIFASSTALCFGMPALGLQLLRREKRTIWAASRPLEQDMDRL